MKKTFLILVILSNLNFAQNKITSNIKNDFSHFFEIGKSLAIQPKNWKSTDWMKFGGVIATTGALFLIDENVTIFSQRNQTSGLNTLFSVDDYYGSYFTLVIPSIFYGYGLFANENEYREIGLKAGEAFVYSGLITLAIKSLVGRNRPYMEKGNSCFSPFSIDNDFNSFPSGHTTVAFAVSTVMADFSDNTFWKIGWYSLAAITGLARIYNNQHWISDVFVGGVIGYSVGQFVLNDSKTISSKDATVLGFNPLNNFFTISIKI